MGLKYIMFAFVILSIGLVAASMNDTKVIICDDINITEPNCTIWWNTFNLTEANFTNINLTNTTYTNTTYINNITLVYDDNRNQTINNTVINTNHSTTKNNTYVTYNYTGNISSLNLSSAYIQSSEVDTKISNSLTPYALKSSIPAASGAQNTTVADELKENLVYWKWSFVILTIIILIAIGILFSKIGVGF